MANKPHSKEPVLPWVEAGEDRFFKWLASILVILFLLAGVYINTIILPEIERRELSDVAPRLAQLIVEKKKIPPPPPPAPKKEIEKPEPEKEVKKPEEKPEVKPEKKPTPEQRRAAAKQKAQKSGLMAMQDDLADLRESFDFSDIGDLPQQKTGKQAVSTVSTSDFLTARASKGSGGITTDTLNRSLTGSELAQRQTSRVTSNIESDSKLAKAGSRSGSSRKGQRSEAEIERVFQQNKGSIFSIYNRELRKDPSLQGKVVVELTIDANGVVTNVIILSSELDNERLEKRLLSRIKSFKFVSKQVPVFTVKYPIEFLPS
jgi:TonB family protein